jgi:hypothetical protein
MGIFGDLLHLLIGPRDANAYLERRKLPEDLDYPNSVVDLLKTLRMDSSFEARKKLAGEYGRTVYSGTAEENTWLHAEIMRRIRERKL